MIFYRVWTSNLAAAVHIDRSEARAKAAARAYVEKVQQEDGHEPHVIVDRFDINLKCLTKPQLVELGLAWALDRESIIGPHIEQSEVYNNYEGPDAT